MTPRELFPTTMDVQYLQQEGFSHDQVAGLLTVRTLYTWGAYHETDPDRKRLEFVRWLYSQGRLES
jgi:hypothetical protein